MQTLAEEARLKEKMFNDAAVLAIREFLDQLDCCVDEAPSDPDGSKDAATATAAKLYNLLADAVDGVSDELKGLGSLAATDSHADTLVPADELSELASHMGTSILNAVRFVVLHYSDPQFTVTDMFAEHFIVEKLKSFKEFTGYGVPGDEKQFVLPGPLAVLDMVADVAPILELYFPLAGALLEQLAVRSRINIAMFNAWTAAIQITS